MIDDNMKHKPVPEEDNGEYWYDKKSKYGSKCNIHLENAKVGDIYALTVNPIDDEKAVGKSYILNDHTRMIALVQKLRYAYVELYPEISPTGRLHYHGYLIIEDIFGFYSHDIRIISKWGNFKLDTIADLQIWVNYVQKQMSIMQPAFKTCDLAYKVSNQKLHNDC